MIFTAGDKAGERGGTIITFFILCWIHVAIKDSVSDGFFLFFGLDDVREKEYSWYGLRHNNCCQHPSDFKAFFLLQRASGQKLGVGAAACFEQYESCKAALAQLKNENRELQMSIISPL